jgi:hypothetical protein
VAAVPQRGLHRLVACLVGALGPRLLQQPQAQAQWRHQILSIAKAQSRHNCQPPRSHPRRYMQKARRPMATPLVCGPQLPIIYYPPSAATNSQHHQANRTTTKASPGTLL